AELRQRVRELLEDLAMVERLEEIRLEQCQLNDEYLDFASADAAYTQAFRAYGLDVEVGPKAAERIRTRLVAVERAAALDNWASVRRLAQGKAASTHNLTALAYAGDNDPLRNRLRQAFAAYDRAQLEALARTSSGAHLSATTRVLFGRALADLGASAAALA